MGAIHWCHDHARHGWMRLCICYNWIKTLLWPGNPNITHELMHFRGLMEADQHVQAADPLAIPATPSFSHTLGGFFLARYDDSPAGAFDEVRLALANCFPSSISSDRHHSSLVWSADLSPTSMTTLTLLVCQCSDYLVLLWNMLCNHSSYQPVGTHQP